MSPKISWTFTAHLLVLGGIFVWAWVQYGWESPRMIWTAILLLVAVLALKLGDLQARLTRLEQRADDQEMNA